MNQGAITLVLDLAGALSGSVSQWCGPVRRISIFSERFACATRLLRAPQESTVRRMCGVTAPDHHSHPPWIEVEVLACDGSVSTLDAEGLRG